MFVWSNQLYCNCCGGTNLWFSARRAIHNRPQRVIKLCKECWLEKERKRRRLRYAKSPETRKRISDYGKNHRDKRRIIEAEYRMRLKVKKQRMC
jgi:hypothetical protein